MGGDNVSLDAANVKLATTDQIVDKACALSFVQVMEIMRMVNAAAFLAGKAENAS